MSSDTIYALSSGSPPAAIAVIRLSGPLAHVSAGRLAGELAAARQVSVRELRGADGELLDRALVLRFDGPASATGEDSVEFHCHGGRAVVEGVLAALGSLDGLRAAKPGEFTRRAFENGRIDLTEAEGLADLLEAETESQRRSALRMAEGGLRRTIDDWRERLLGLSARAEAAIDYVDEDSVDADPEIFRDCASLAKELGDWLQRPAAEPLRDGVRVVLAGPPNSGKSSLLNVLVGRERAIVTDVPGTTRDHIDVPVALAGVPLLLTDTAGLRETEEAVELMGIERARSLIERADVVLWLGDPADAPANARTIVVHSKCDLPQRQVVRPNSYAVSAATGDGVARITAAIVKEAKAILPAEGELALNRRQRDCIAQAETALGDASTSAGPEIVAEALRTARSAFDRLTGNTGVEDLLDTLFGRFCLGK